MQLQYSSEATPGVTQFSIKAVFSDCGQLSELSDEELPPEEQDIKKDETINNDAKVFLNFFIVLIFS